MGRVGWRAVSVGVALVLALSACGQRLERRDPREPAPLAAKAELSSGEGTDGQGTPAAGKTGRKKGRPPGPAPVGSSSSAPASPTGPAANGQTLTLGTATLRQDRVAVIIGIDDYPGEDTDLVAAVADARVVRRALVRMGFGRVVFLVNGQATGDRILWAARWLAENSTKRTVGAFFYAGHVRQVAGDPDGDGEDIDEAIVAADGRLLLDGELADALEGATGPLWLAFASCYAAGFSDAAGPGRVASYASDEESLAYESAALGQSFMVEYVVRRAMLDAGITSVEGAHARAWREMRREARRFRPLLDDRLAGDLDLGPGPPPRAGPEPGAQACLVVLRCG